MSTSTSAGTQHAALRASNRSRQSTKRALSSRRVTRAHGSGAPGSTASEAGSAHMPANAVLRQGSRRQKPAMRQSRHRVRGRNLSRSGQGTKCINDVHFHHCVASPDLRSSTRSLRRVLDARRVNRGNLRCGVGTAEPPMPTFPQVAASTGVYPVRGQRGGIPGAGPEGKNCLLRFAMPALMIGICVVWALQHSRMLTAKTGGCTYIWRADPSGRPLGDSRVEAFVPPGPSTSRHDHVRLGSAPSTRSQLARRRRCAVVCCAAVCVTGACFLARVLMPRIVYCCAGQLRARPTPGQAAGDGLRSCGFRAFQALKSKAVHALGCFSGQGGCKKPGGAYATIPVAPIDEELETLQVPRARVWRLRDVHLAGIQSLPCNIAKAVSCVGVAGADQSYPVESPDRAGTGPLAEGKGREATSRGGDPPRCAAPDSQPGSRRSPGSRSDHGLSSRSQGNVRGAFGPIKSEGYRRRHPTTVNTSMGCIALSATEFVGGRSQSS